jgi:hypothetical protein
MKDHQQSKSNVTKPSTRKENSVNRAIDNNDECLTVVFVLVDLYPLYYSTYRHGNEIKNASSNHTIKREKKRSIMFALSLLLSSIYKEISFAIGAFFVVSSFLSH